MNIATLAEVADADLEQLFPDALVFGDVDLYEVVQRVFHETVRYVAQSLDAVNGIQVLPKVESIGGFIANPAHAGNYGQVWNNPSQLIGCTFGFGPQQRRYSFNAARKGRATARTGLSSHLIPATDFQDVVGSAADGEGRAADLRWGDFPHGGAVILGEGQSEVIVGISALNWEQDFGGSAWFAGILVPILRNVLATSAP